MDNVAAMKAKFRPDGVAVDLEPLEYGFLALTIGHVLYGMALSDNDFRNMLGMSRQEAEALHDALAKTEDDAKANGTHWLNRPSSPS